MAEEDEITGTQRGLIIKKESSKKGLSIEKKNKHRMIMRGS